MHGRCKNAAMKKRTVDEGWSRVEREGKNLRTEKLSCARDDVRNNLVNNFQEPFPGSKGRR